MRSKTVYYFFEIFLINGEIALSEKLNVDVLHMSFVGPCHHSMGAVRLRMEKRPPMWRVSVNKLNKPTRGGPPAWGLGKALTTPPCEKQNVMKYS